MEGQKPSPSFCVRSLWLCDDRSRMCKDMRRALQAPMPWCATFEPVLKPLFPTRVGRVGRNVAFGERGGGRSCDDCAGARPGSCPGRSHQTAAAAVSPAPPHRGSLTLHLPPRRLPARGGDPGINAPEPLGMRCASCRDRLSSAAIRREGSKASCARPSGGNCFISWR